MAMFRSIATPSDPAARLAAASARRAAGSNHSVTECTLLHRTRGHYRTRSCPFYAQNEMHPDSYRILWSVCFSRSTNFTSNCWGLTK